MNQTTTIGALTLTTYPHNTVRLSCAKCGQKGQYRRARLIERFGADKFMPDVLREPPDYPDWRDMSDPCRTTYPDLSVRAEQLCFDIVADCAKIFAPENRSVRPRLDWA